MFTHLSTINGITQNFQNVGEIDIEVLEAEVNQLSYVANNGYANLHTSPMNDGIEISDDDDDTEEDDDEEEEGHIITDIINDLHHTTLTDALPDLASFEIEQMLDQESTTNYDIFKSTGF